MSVRSPPALRLLSRAVGLQDPVSVTIKCGRRYLVEDRGMLRWAELSKASGYRDSACFVLEKVRAGGGW